MAKRNRGRNNPPNNTTDASAIIDILKQLVEHTGNRVISDLELVGKLTDDERRWLMSDPKSLIPTTVNNCPRLFPNVCAMILGYISSQTQQNNSEHNYYNLMRLLCHVYVFSEFANTIKFKTYQDSIDFALARASLGIGRCGDMCWKLIKAIYERKNINHTILQKYDIYNARIEQEQDSHAFVILVKKGSALDRQLRRECYYFGTDSQLIDFDKKDIKPTLKEFLKNHSNAIIADAFYGVAGTIGQLRDGIFNIAINSPLTSLILVPRTRVINSEGVKVFQDKMHALLYKRTELNRAYENVTSTSENYTITAAVAINMINSMLVEYKNAHKNIFSPKNIALVMIIAVGVYLLSSHWGNNAYQQNEEHNDLPSNVNSDACISSLGC